MADDRPQNRSEPQPDDIAPSPDGGRAKRAPPTIDLEATEVSDHTPNGAGETPEAESAQQDASSAPPEPEAVNPDVGGFESAKASPPVSPAISPWVIAPVSGAVAAALVIGVGWMLGWPAIQPATPAPPQVDTVANTAAIKALAVRLSSVEAKAGKPANPVPDAAAAARIDGLEKSIASLRSDVTATRAQSEKLAAAISDIKSAPPGQAAAMPDLSSDLSRINERLDKLEHTQHADSAAIAQDNAKLADDAPLRRVVVASLLDLSVRQGEPFVATLAAAKSMAPDAEALKPLDGFAASGVPTAAGLSRELLTLIPKLTPPVQTNDSTGSGLVDRLKVGAERLVRIERTDGVGNDPRAIVARITTAALHNDYNEARRELNMLSSSDRAAAQSWIDKVNARDAALAASHQFATDAMTALAKPSQ
jgi:hypothetical protein